MTNQPTPATYHPISDYIRCSCGKTFVTCAKARKLLEETRS